MALPPVGRVRLRVPAPVVQPPRAAEATLPDAPVPKPVAPAPPAPPATARPTGRVRLAPREAAPRRPTVIAGVAVAPVEPVAPDSEVVAPTETGLEAVAQETVAAVQAPSAATRTVHRPVWALLRPRTRPRVEPAAAGPEPCELTQEERGALSFFFGGPEMPLARGRGR